MTSDIRVFAVSKAFYGGVLVDQIMQVCHWKAHNTFTNFNVKDLAWSDDNMYLGPVVATQVLDPFPQTAHPQKEKRGWGHICCSQVFRSLITGSRYWLPPEDVIMSPLYHYYI